MIMRRSVACRCCRTLLNFFKLIQTSFVKSSQEIRPELLSTTRKQINIAVNGSHRRQRGRWKQDSPSQKSMSCWLFSSISGVSSSANSFHGFRWLVKKHGRRFCSVCFAQCTRRYFRYFWAYCVCFITTMHLLRMSWASSRFLPRGKLPHYKDRTITIIFAFLLAHGNH